MPIKKLLRIILILFSIIPASIIGFLTFSYVEKTLITSRERDLNYLASYSTSQVALIFNTQIYELNGQALKWLYQSSLENPAQNDDTNTFYNIKHSEEIQTSLSTTASKYTYCTTFGLYDTDGRALITSNMNFKKQKDKDKEFSLPISTKREKAEVTFSSSKIGSFYLIHITKPILSKNKKVLGYLSSAIKISYFEYLFDYSLGNTSEILLVDKNGSILYAKNRSLINTKLKDDSISSILNTSNQSVAKTFITHYNGNKEIFAISPVEDTDCFVVIKQDISEITRGATVILYILLGCSVVMFILVFFASYLFARYYTAPIFMLRDSMKRVSNGEFGVRCQIDSKNEAGDLAKSFNKMIQIIQSSYDDLSSMHEQLLDNEEEIRSNYNHIEYLAYHDLITNLPNKLFFLEKVDMMLTVEEDAKLMHAIYFIDLDNFKTINDTLGHDFGDEILSLTGKKLTSLVSERDMVARVGGDEFLIFKYNISSTHDAFQFAQVLIKSFSKPFAIWNETIHISLSIGVSIYPLHGKTHKTLIKNADIAMYQSKENGKNRVSLFDKSMSEELNRNTDILDVLRTAIEKQEIYLMYQPQINIVTKEIIGYEALMRICSEKLGPLSPKDFIPIAEESELIIDLGEWALKEACMFNKSLIDTNRTPCPVSVNISSIQLNKSDFVQTVQRILTETKLPANYLILEITESTLISSLVDTVSVLKHFKEMGVHISLDDFGTGYSSLKYLTTLPISTLKIDKSFIDNICFNDKDRFIAKSIISLAHKIEMDVIAEGVESTEQYELLKDDNCDIIQGFLFSRPVPPNTLITLLNETF